MKKSLSMKYLLQSFNSRCRYRVFFSSKTIFICWTNFHKKLAT